MSDLTREQLQKLHEVIENEILPVVKCHSDKITARKYLDTSYYVLGDSISRSFIVELAEKYKDLNPKEFRLCMEKRDPVAIETNFSLKGSYNEEDLVVLIETIKEHIVKLQNLSKENGNDFYLEADYDCSPYYTIRGLGLPPLVDRSCEYIDSLIYISQRIRRFLKEIDIKEQVAVKKIAEEKAKRDKELEALKEQAKKFGMKLVEN